MSDQEPKSPVQGRMEVDEEEKNEGPDQNAEPPTEVGELLNPILGPGKRDDEHSGEDDKGLFEDWDAYFGHGSDELKEHVQRSEMDVQALTLEEAARKEGEAYHRQDDCDWGSEESDGEDEEVMAITSTMTEGTVAVPRDLLGHGGGSSSSNGDEDDEEREDNEYPDTNDVPDHDDRSNNPDDNDGDGFPNEDDLLDPYSPPPSKRPRLFF